MIHIDPVTRAEYNAQTSSGAKAQAVIDALANPVTITVYNELVEAVGTGTFNTPWATRSNNVVSLGEVANFEVTTTDTPEEGWRIRFSSGSRWIEGSFGLVGQGKDFSWSLSTWEDNQQGRVQNASVYAYIEVVEKDAPLSYDVLGPSEAGPSFVGLPVSTTFTIPQGTAFSDTFTAYDPNPGDQILFTITGGAGLNVTQNTQVGQNRSVTISGSSALAPGTYSVEIVPTSPTLTPEQDWINRSTAPGVVWAHDFRLKAEVDNFRASQNAIALDGSVLKTGKSPDPNGVGYHTIEWGTDKIAGTNGKSLLTYAPKAFGAGKYFSNENAFAKAIDLENTNVTPSFGETPVHLQANQLCGLEMISGGGWVRPFAALTMTNSSLPPDLAANNTLPRFTWNPNDAYQGGYWAADAKGFFVHPDYVTGSQLTSGKVYGNEFWIQFRIKFNTGRFAYRNDPSGTGSATPLKADIVANKPQYPWSYGKQFTPGGKLAFIGKYNGAEQYIIPISGTALYEYFYPGGQPFNWYGKYGGMNSGVPLPENPSVVSIQPQSPYELTCTLQPAADFSQPNMCWMWEPDQWVTVLCHIRPGRKNTVVDGGNNDTLIEFKVAREGETSYTTIYSANRGVVFSGPPVTSDTDPPGWCSLAFDCYFNNVPSFAYISQTYTQVILSTQEIPCPQY